MKIVDAIQQGSAYNPSDSRDASRLVTPTLLAVFVAMNLPLCNFYLLLSTLPVLVQANGAGQGTAGLTTGSLMAATVLAEFAVPYSVSRWGYRRLAQVALLMLTFSTMALCISLDLSLALLLSVVRGVGLGIVFVVSSAIVAHVAVPSRRAEALALSGALSGIVAVVCVPVGVWIAARGGPFVLITLSALVALGGLATVHRIPAYASDSRPLNFRLDFQLTRLLLAPAAALALIAMAAAIFMTFAPFIGVPGGYQSISVALAVYSAASVFARWASGRVTIRPSYALGGAAMFAGAGLAAISLAPHLTLFYLGAALTGLAFGAAQNVTLVWMFERASPAQYDKVSAAWNIAYDGGLGMGAAAFGFVLARLGHQMAFTFAGGLLSVVTVGILVVFRTNRSARVSRIVNVSHGRHRLLPLVHQWPDRESPGRAPTNLSVCSADRIGGSRSPRRLPRDPSDIVMTPENGPAKSEDRMCRSHCGRPLTERKKGCSRLNSIVCVIAYEQQDEVPGTQTLRAVAHAARIRSDSSQIELAHSDRLPT